MTKNRELVSSLFSNLLNKPVRDPQQGHGSFLTMGFGKNLQYEVIRRREKKINTRPEWYLWIYMCAWELEDSSEILATSDDDRETIAKALNRLTNKKLLDVKVLNDTYDMKLEFEDGLILSLISDNSEDDNEQWMLYTPEKKVLVAGPHETLTYEDSSSNK